jgi:hypothetical protein
MPARVAPTWPRMMKRSLAALYCDLTVKDFEGEVLAGRLPQPVILGGEEHWSTPHIDEHLERLCGAKVPDWRANAKFYKDRQGRASA